MSLSLLSDSRLRDGVSRAANMNTPEHNGSSVHFFETNITDASQGSTAPSTPTSGIRVRHSTGDVRLRTTLFQFPTASQPGNNASPTSTYSESTETAFRLNDRSALHAVLATPLSPPARKVVMRSDPSLLTCFDPADKELYDLWAPHR